MKFIQFVYRFILLHLDCEKELIYIPVDALMFDGLEIDYEYLDLDTELFDNDDWDKCFNVLNTISQTPLLEMGDEGEYFMSFPSEYEEVIRDEVGLRRIIGHNEELRSALLGVATYDNERAEEFQGKVIDLVESLNSNSSGE